jgi:hypothetical protein
MAVFDLQHIGTKDMATDGFIKSLEDVAHTRVGEGRRKRGECMLYM